MEEWEQGWNSRLLTIPWQGCLGGCWTWKQTEWGNVSALEPDTSWRPITPCRITPLPFMISHFGVASKGLVPLGSMSTGCLDLYLLLMTLRQRSLEMPWRQEDIRPLFSICWAMAWNSRKKPADPPTGHTNYQTATLTGTATWPVDQITGNKWKLARTEKVHLSISLSTSARSGLSKG